MTKDNLKTEPFDASEYLNNETRIRLFIEEAFETGDPAFIVKCLGLVAKARSMSRLAEETGMSRTSLYKALSGEGRPEFETILKVARALRLDLTVKSHMPDAA